MNSMKRAAAALLVGGVLVAALVRGAGAQGTHLYGLYPAVVVSSTDPLQKARLRVRIPTVSAANEVWALASVPYGDGNIASVKLPAAGAEVWVEFQAGDPSTPVWLGWKPR